MPTIILEVQYRGPFSKEWQSLGRYYEDQNGSITLDQLDLKNELFRQADQRVGYLRVIEAEPRVRFGRATRLTKKPASDDCHTYS